MSRERERMTHKSYRTLTVVLAKARTRYPKCSLLRDAGITIPFIATVVVMGLSFRQDDEGGSLVHRKGRGPWDEGDRWRNLCNYRKPS